MDLPMGHRLDILPVELVQIIATTLRDCHSPSFVSFTWTNKAIRAACLELQFSRIVIEIGLRQDPKPEIARCLEALRKNDLFALVRRLSLTLIDDSDRFPRRPPSTDLARIPGAYSIALDVVQRKASGVQDVTRDGISYWAAKFPLIREHTWPPFVRLLEAMPHLRDLYFHTHSDLFPECLLLYLRDHRPSCRLHINQFQFRSHTPLIQDPLEIALATSPNLHHIGVDIVEDILGREPPQNYNYRAVLDMISGLAPNLRSIQLTSRRLDLGNRDRSEWQGFEGVSLIPRKLLLTSFSLHSNMGLSQWYDTLDASTLRSLSLGSTPSVSQTHLFWMAQNADFPNLKSLSFVASSEILRPWSDKVPFDRPLDAMVAFLNRLPPLEELVLLKEADAKLVNLIIPHHGPSLRTLVVGANNYGRNFKRKTFHLIAQHCRALQELTTPVRRTASGVEEARCLDAIAGIKSLHTVDLTFSWKYMNDEIEEYIDALQESPNTPPRTSPAWNADPLPPKANEPFWDSWDHQRNHRYSQRNQPPVRNGDLRNELVKAAVDAELARTIWGRLCSRGCRLQTLRLRTNTPSSHVRSYSDMLSAITSVMKASYILERSVLGGDKVFLADLSDDSDIEYPDEELLPEDDSRRAYGQLWPKKNSDGVGFPFNWVSFPLPP